MTFSRFRVRTHLEDRLFSTGAVDVDELAVGFGAVEHRREHRGLRLVRAGISDESMVEPDFADCRAVLGERYRARRGR